MRRPSPDDVPLFDLPSEPSVERPDRPTSTAAKPKWTTYKGRERCDDCVLVLHQHQGNGPATWPARWRRTCDGSDLLLCYPHARLWRADDGLEPLHERENRP